MKYTKVTLGLIHVLSLYFLSIKNGNVVFFCEKKIIFAPKIDDNTISFYEHS